MKIHELLKPKIIYDKNFYNLLKKNYITKL